MKGMMQSKEGKYLTTKLIGFFHIHLFLTGFYCIREIGVYLISSTFLLLQNINPLFPLKIIY